MTSAVQPDSTDGWRQPLMPGLTPAPPPPHDQCMLYGILMGILVVIAGLTFAFGFMGAQGANPFLIGLGLLLMAFCAIFGVQPDWPVRHTGPDKPDQ
jgi:hypothetical protein